MKEGSNWSRLSPRLSFIAPILSGLLLSLSLPKWNFAYLAFFALMPLFLYLCIRQEKDHSFNTVLFSSLFFGLPYFAVTLYWIVYTLDRFTPLPTIVSISLLILLCLYLSTYYFFIFYIAQRLALFSEPNFIKGLAFAFLWVGVEYVRGTLFGGLPWGFAGEALANYHILLQTADILGIYGLSFLAILLNYSFYTLSLPFIRAERGLKAYKVSLIRVLPIFFLVICSILYGVYAVSLWEERLKTEPSALKVALLQGNIPQELKESKEAQISLKVYEELFHQALSHQPDLIFTPETAFPFYFPYEHELSLKLVSFLLEARKREGSIPPFIFGAFRVSRSSDEVKVHNSLFVWDDANISDFYDKERLVPFGEYIPLGRYFPFLKKFSVVSDILRPGQGKNLEAKLKDRVLVFTPLICFESAFSDLARKRLKQGGELIFVATNDAWFGKTSAPYQHFRMLKLRAVENRRFALQVANTGISGVVTPTGKVLVSSNLEKQEVMVAEIKPLYYLTFYQRYGHLFAKGCGLLFAGALLLVALIDFVPRLKIFFKTQKL